LEHFHRANAFKYHVHFQALNNLQCTAAGYGRVTKEAVYKICDEPHPDKLREVLDMCLAGESQKAFDIVDSLCQLGYSVDDIITSIFKLVKIHDLPEIIRLEFIMVSFCAQSPV